MSGKGLPVADDTNDDLTNDDTDDLEVFNGRNPRGVANGLLAPTLREGGLEKRLDVANREEDIAVISQIKPRTRKVQ